MSAAGSVEFVPLGVVGEAGAARRPLLAPPEAGRSPTSQASAGEAGTIEIALPNGVRICVAGLVSEKREARSHPELPGSTRNAPRCAVMVGMANTGHFSEVTPWHTQQCRRTRITVSLRGEPPCVARVTVLMV